MHRRCRPAPPTTSSSPSSAARSRCCGSTSDAARAGAVCRPRRAPPRSNRRARDGGAQSDARARATQGRDGDSGASGASSPETFFEPLSAAELAAPGRASLDGWEAWPPPRPRYGAAGAAGVRAPVLLPCMRVSLEIEPLDLTPRSVFDFPDAVRAAPGPPARCPGAFPGADVILPRRARRRRPARITRRPRSPCRRPGARTRRPRCAVQGCMPCHACLTAAAGTRCVRRLRCAAQMQGMRPGQHTRQRQRLPQNVYLHCHALCCRGSGVRPRAPGRQASAH